MRVMMPDEGRSTPLGQTATQSWQPVQCWARWRRLTAPGGTIGVWRAGAFLSRITARPPSTFFSWARTRPVPSSIPVPVRNERREACCGAAAGFFALEGCIPNVRRR